MIYLPGSHHRATQGTFVQQYPILQTKLYIPPIRPELVSRPRLIERLNEGLHRKLTLISAPAGFGKTTLVSEWVAGCERPAAWLSLDEGDSDLARFLTYLVAALQTIAANIGEGVLGALQSPQPPPTESILTALLNEIAAIPDDFILVLDDYHVIDAKPVDDALTFLLEHLPPQMHLVIATREDPASAPGPVARPGPIDRAARRRLAFYPRRSRRISQPGDGPQPLGGRHRRPGNPHRRLDCRPANGRALHAGASRHRQFYPGFHRQPPFCAGLSGRRGPSAPARTCAQLLAANRHSRQVEWSSVRCRHRARRRQRDAGGPGARQPVRRSARRQAPVVSLSPPLRRRPAGALDGGAARSGIRPCIGGRASGTSRTVCRPMPSATRLPPRISSGRRA